MDNELYSVGGLSEEVKKAFANTQRRAKGIAPHVKVTHNTLLAYAIIALNERLDKDPAFLPSINPLENTIILEEIQQSA